MENLGINFVNADQGGLIFRIATAEGDISRRADTIVDGVHWAKQYGFSDAGTYFSSDMDYASEEGFADNDGAKNFFDSIVDAL